MNSDRQLNRPILARSARYRWDEVRGEHQLVFPEGVLVLNQTGAAIVRLCDGRATADLVAALESQFEGRRLAADAIAFLDRLASKGLLSNADS